ncbi:Uncharacterised protein [BD1-7 clade bacterium]|uniref:Uncharacterized protein n=1 Tax=BD1-7 clade bacterium TaxID=2029982 RepID=A0A5S9PGD7_9GAMM|nr:Uncharacterised protein [BD1-7 clade bacterium]CAA0103212.1 Uncharacterised protein [BD1-7 clade bacterium]
MECNSFGHYFNENLKALGLPTFNEAYSSAKNITEIVAGITASVHTFGKAATVGEVLGATVAVEKAAAAAGLLASFYAGACVGSLFVAATKANECDRISRPKVDRHGRPIRSKDVVAWATENAVNFPELSYLLERYPEIMDPASNKSNMLAFQASGFGQVAA